MSLTRTGVDICLRCYVIYHYEKKVKPLRKFFLITDVPPHGLDEGVMFSRGYLLFLP